MFSSRRRFLVQASALVAQRGFADTRAQWTARQFHNQPEQSHQHKFLVKLWDAVRKETNGRFACTVFARNANIAGSDPAALKMLISGELEFFTLMGGILGKEVPVTEIQGLPFAFSSHQQVHRVMDGELGNYLRREMAAKGIYGFPRGLLENGFRHISMIDGPIRGAGDLRGKKIRVPDGEMFTDLFRTLGAEPVIVNIRELYDSLKTRRVDGQENPLVVTEVNKLYEVTRYLSMTSHMWSGFNMLANLKFWNALPGGVRGIISRNVVKYVAQQRRYTNGFNRTLSTQLAQRGMLINTADTTTFRAPLGPFYQRWKERLGSKAWGLLEGQVGRLG